MVISFYKVVAEFDLDGAPQQLGSEIFLPEREGEKLVKQGVVVQGRTLDPEDVDDAKKIKEAEEAHDARYAVAKKKEEARDEQKEDELIEEDGKRDELLKEAEELIAKIAEDTGGNDVADLEAISRLETSDIEKEVEKLRAIDAGEDEEIDLDSEPEAEVTEAKTKRNQK